MKRLYAVAAAFVLSLGLMVGMAIPASALPYYTSMSCKPAGHDYGLRAYLRVWHNPYLYHSKIVHIYGTAWSQSWVSEKINLTDISLFYPRTFTYAPPAHPAVFTMGEDAYRVGYYWKLPVWFAPDWHSSCVIYIPYGW